MIPGNMTTPRMKLQDGEEILETHQGMRRKGILGNRYGELLITNQRVTFVKAIMKGLVAAAISKKGAKPMLSFDRSSITNVEKLAMKKQTALIVSDGTRSEKFVLDEAAIDALLPSLQTS